MYGKSMDLILAGILGRATAPMIHVWRPLVRNVLLRLSDLYTVNPDLCLFWSENRTSNLVFSKRILVGFFLLKNRLLNKDHLTYHHDLWQILFDISTAKACIHTHILDNSKKLLRKSDETLWAVLHTKEDTDEEGHRRRRIAVHALMEERRAQPGARSGVWRGQCNVCCTIFMAQ